MGSNILIEVYPPLPSSMIKGRKGLMSESDFGSFPKMSYRECTGYRAATSEMLLEPKSRGKSDNGFTFVVFSRRSPT